MKYILKNTDTNNLVVSAPDIGGLKTANILATDLCVPLVTVYKERNYSKANCIESMQLIGDVSGKDVVLVDDILDTGGTLISAIDLLKSKGANKIYFFVSLALLNGPAIERIDKSFAENKLFKIVTTDAVYRSDEFVNKHDWLEIAPISKYFAEVVFNLHLSRSIAKVFEHRKEKTEKDIKKLNE